MAALPLSHTALRLHPPMRRCSLVVVVDTSGENSKSSKFAARPIRSGLEFHGSTRHTSKAPNKSKTMTQVQHRRKYGTMRQNAATLCSDTSEVEVKELQQVKNSLLRAVSNTGRGLNVSSQQRASIEEIVVDAERFNAGVSLDLSLLHGTWLLQYTTAPDVVSILQAAELPFFQVGQIFQKFDCLGNSDSGTVLNVVRWSIPGLLQDIEGATLTVKADFSTVSSRNIQLHFKEAKVGEIYIGEGVEALIAPAILPRTFVSLQVLQFLRTLSIRVPLSTKNTSGARKRASVGLLYYLTYLDRDMLLGRALGNGGEFIFSRTQALHV